MSEQVEAGNGSPAHTDVGVESGPDIEHKVAGFLDEALSSVLDSARRSAADLVERTRKASEDHLVESRRLQEEAERRTAVLTEHQTRVESLAGEVYRKVEDVRTQVREVPGRLEAALSPLKEALVSIEVVIGDLSETLRAIQEHRAPGPDGDPDPNRPRVTVRAFEPAPSSGDWDVAAAYAESNGPAAEPTGEASPAPSAETASPGPEEAEAPVHEHVAEPDEGATADPVELSDHPDHWKFLRPADIDWRDLPSAQAS
jgi:hypothetical protein